MTEEQKTQAINKLEYFFSSDESDFFQLNNLIKSEKNKTIKCLLITSAFDLLSQYYSGELKNNRTSKRFKELLIECGNITTTEAELLFQFRNALCHHYGTFTYNHLANKKYRFKIVSNHESLFEEKDQFIFVSSVVLEKLYINTTELLKIKLKQSDSCLKNFIKIYKFIRIEK